MPPSRSCCGCESGRESFSGTEISPTGGGRVPHSSRRPRFPVPHVVGLASGGAALLLEHRLRIGDLTEHETTTTGAETMASFVNTLRRRCTTSTSTPSPSTASRRDRCVPGDQARLDLEMWAKLFAAARRTSSPFVRSHRARGSAPTRPSTPSGTVLVQGDTGPGNFVFEDGKVTGIVDWGTRTSATRWTTGPGSRSVPGCSDAVSPRGCSRAVLTCGPVIEIDHDRIRYYRAAVEPTGARWTTSLAVSRGGGPPVGAPLPRDRAVRPRARRAHGRADGRGRARRSAHGGRRRARTPLYDHLLEATAAGCGGVEDIDVHEGHAQPPDPRALLHTLRRGQAPTSRRESTTPTDARLSAPTRSTTARSSPRSVEQAGADGDEHAVPLPVPNTCTANTRCELRCSNAPAVDQPDTQPASAAGPLQRLLSAGSLGTEAGGGSGRTGTGAEIPIPMSGSRPPISGLKETAPRSRMRSTAASGVTISYIPPLPRSSSGGVEGPVGRTAHPDRPRRVVVGLVHHIRLI